MSSASEPNDVPAGFTPLFRTSPFLDAVGPFYSRQDEDGLVIGLRIAPKHANARGLAHGGLLLTLVSADFAGSARVGDWVESRADIQRVGRQLAFVNVYLVVNNTRIVRASGVYLRREAA
jgi:acyl-coenzyme A thioesterase PaaI-like protein